VADVASVLTVTKPETSLHYTAPTTTTTTKRFTAISVAEISFKLEQQFAARAYTFNDNLLHFLQH